MEKRVYQISHSGSPICVQKVRKSRLLEFALGLVITFVSRRIYPPKGERACKMLVVLINRQFIWALLLACEADSPASILPSVQAA